MVRCVILIFIMAFSSTVWSEKTRPQVSPNDETAMCRYGADHMISIAQQSLAEKSSRSERVESRRILVEEWTSRLKAGEDPCTVYADIQKKSVTF